MTLQKDSSNHPYLEVENLRLTYVSSKDRLPDKDWPGCDVIRIQAIAMGFPKPCIEAQNCRSVASLEC